MSRWKRPARGLISLPIPIAQGRERTRPKRQVAGEIPAGDTIFCGCGSTAECGRAKAETTVRFRSPAPFLSLWCSPDNMPASHAGDHRSEAGQGRQVLFAIYELRFPISVAVHKHLGALLFAKRTSIVGHLTCRTWEDHSGWGSILVAVRKWWPCASIAVEPALRRAS